MSRPTRFEHNQWLGDKRTLRVHNLDNIQPSCGLDELLASERYASFGPDLLAEARNRGYRAHRPCVGRSEAGSLPQ